MIGADVGAGDAVGGADVGADVGALVGADVGADVHNFSSSPASLASSDSHGSRAHWQFSTKLHTESGQTGSSCLLCWSSWGIHTK